MACKTWATVEILIISRQTAVLIFQLTAEHLTVAKNQQATSVFYTIN